MDVIYLDNNATTKPAPEVVAAMLPYLTDFYANPSSLHRFGQRSRQAIDEARSQVAALIHSADAQLTFTGGGTEAVNTAIRGLLATRSPRTKIVTTTVEHSATRELCQQLAREGAQVIEIGVSHDGALNLDTFRSAIDDTAALATVMWANNETGVLFPVADLQQICKEKKVPLHIDATQAVGKIPVDVTALELDAISFAAHKFHGIKGVGSLFLRRGLRLKPTIIGGPQESGRRGGTENVPGIVGMGAASVLALRGLDETPHIAQLRDRLEHSILKKVSGTFLNGSAENRLPNTTNIGFERLEAEAILLLLSEQNICASSGAACSSGSLEPSHVLRAMHIDDKIAHGAIRFSLSRYTTNDEIDRTLAVLPGIISRLRAVLPV